MDFFIAKLKGNGNNYAKLVSDKTIYEQIPDLTKCRQYDDDYKLNDDEWFVVENFSQKPYCPKLFTENFDITQYSFLNFGEYKNIDFTVSIQKNEFFIVQNVTPSYVYSKYRAIAWNRVLLAEDKDQPKLIEQEGVVVLKEHPDCYYNKTEDKLYFKNLSALTSIFKGINELFKEATDNEVEELLGWNDILQVEGNFGKKDVNTANRRKIKEAITKYGSFNEDQKSTLKGYMNAYCSGNIDSNSNKFKISNESDLTNFLNCVNERFYTTPISSQKRLANSITDINNQTPTYT